MKDRKLILRGILVEITSVVILATLLFGTCYILEV